MSAHSLIPKTEFVGLEHVAHLAAGGESPPLASHLDAMKGFMLDKSVGMPARARLYDTADRVREQAANLLGARPEEIALLWNATAGLHNVALAIDWQPGDNVVAAASEFPSLLHVWQANGIELRAVGAQPVPTIADYAAAMNAQTRAIVVSHVSYLTGARIDVAEFRDLADAHGARLILDASHSLGVVPVDSTLCDVVVSCCYKWLLGTHGVAIFCANSERWPDLRPRTVGWNAVVGESDWRKRGTYELKPTMECFEGGNPSFLPIYYLRNALTRLGRLDPADVEAHALELGGRVRSGLVDLGADVLTPERAEARAGNIAIATPHADRLEGALRERGVLAWGGDNRLRISVHVYNDATDVNRLLTETARLRDLL